MQLSCPETPVQPPISTTKRGSAISGRGYRNRSSRRELDRQLTRGCGGRSQHADGHKEQVQCFNGHISNLAHDDRDSNLRFYKRCDLCSCG